jgi:hypothetical protein
VHLHRRGRRLSYFGVGPGNFYCFFLFLEKSGRTYLNWRSRSRCTAVTILERLFEDILCGTNVASLHRHMTADRQRKVYWLIFVWGLEISNFFVLFLKKSQHTYLNCCFFLFFLKRIRTHISKLAIKIALQFWNVFFKIYYVTQTLRIYTATRSEIRDAHI